MPKSLADGKIKVTHLATEPTGDLDSLSATVLNAGTDIQCNILKSDFRLSATASDTVGDTELCQDGNSVVFGASNYEGNMTVFRYYDETGAVAVSEDTAWAAAKEKGTHLYLAVRQSGKKHDEDWAAGDEYELWHVITDEPQMPSDLAGYIKRTVPLGPQSKTTGTVAA